MGQRERLGWLAWRIDWNGERRFRLPAPLDGKRWGGLTRAQREAIDYRRRVARAREGAKYAAEFARLYGGPPDCLLTPPHCERLARSIAAAGNEVPDWIAAAARASVVANGG